MIRSASIANADLHYDYATQGDERIRQILDRAKSEKVDFIVSLGDITAPFAQYDHVIEKFKSSGLTLYQVLGNHDVKEDLHKTMEFLGLKEPYYSFTCGDIRDTGGTWPCGTFLEWGFCRI